MQSNLMPMQDFPTDPQQGYFRRGARGDGNQRSGPRGHDAGLRDEKNR